MKVKFRAALTASPRLRVGAGYAHIVRGALLETAIQARSLSYPYVSLNVGF